MAFLKKSESALVNIIKADSSKKSAEKMKLILDIEYTARLRQDRFRQPVKVFLSVISNHINSKIKIGNNGYTS